MKETLTEKTVFRGINALAKRCGVGPSYMSKVMHGKLHPSDRVIEEMRKAGVEPPAASLALPK